ncbi:Orotidine 5'-phosphate decarboxylase [Methylobacterium cerastii]|uniref:Orotidine 5'-phosphate decarboxylase n=1 Tax=Methylobacterium cerastii TaxID=932741 RepID=A0ABQ4QFG1_9HYPH|nr:orotidine-5'-phosphate decarboxylase [Methylobacterium cerastii]GJD43610.1 Orotidine 5'-phosphate decarboxylase [Methylobacterium cerastii]
MRDSTSQSPTDPRDRLIVALDLDEPAAARAMVDRIGDAATFYKIGYRLAYAGGLALVPELAARGLKVFLDLKLHDIGNTVEEGVRALSGLGATFLTVHAYPQTMRAAVRGRGTSSLKIIAVTVLTSYDEGDARESGYALPISELVAHRAFQAAEAGIDGIVCSAFEAQAVRNVVGPASLIVTPGIRPAGSDSGDQKRVMTPGQARAAGIDHVVVGRPITAAADPRAVTQAILAEMAAQE